VLNSVSSDVGFQGNNYTLQYITIKHFVNAAAYTTGLEDVARALRRILTYVGNLA